ncbi:biotin-dependent carboxyltransferase family protein [Alteromonas sp. ASW11-36]|uniref:Biotin-dependent carboxyltransferase family protein n=1 Tax=Alteromonas arenosi TaxID=3055817 RepID=A0ABT7SXN0_9ALTE|nr:biotin-dependent carboxyltransferase family protein [Alteromonas sp. ASW11-36]MDM7860925.1 biotin-dependent carboxyltransferase family protein [Alteromonas sp. ASW11-36]
MSLRVLQTSLLSLIVDAGRRGLMHKGITPSGPMDWFAYDINNRLLANAHDSACIEIHQGELLFESGTSMTCAATGYGVMVGVNGQEKSSWAPFSISKGDTVSIKTTSEGKVAYFGIADGVDAPTTYDSRCTVMREQVGGLANQGQPLCSGDILTQGNARLNQISIGLFNVNKLMALVEYMYQSRPLRVSAGNQLAVLGRKAWATLLCGEYRLTAEHSRMGSRLVGPPLCRRSVSMRSEGLVQGSIQVPPNGQPIIMNADHQTMGGYPKLANVCRIDWPLFASMPIDSSICFVESDTAQARFLLQHTLQQIDSCFNR